MRIPDNSTIPINNDDELSKWNSSVLIKQIEGKNLSELQRDGMFIFPEILADTKDLDDKQKILEINNKQIKTGNIMGILGRAGERLTICSRFESCKDNDYFFYYMLKKVMNINFISEQFGVKSENNYLELLMYLFPSYLNNALKKGLYKEYKTFNYNDLNVKGNIDIKKQLKMNVPFTGKIAYQTREYTPENQVIYLIRHTIECIKNRQNGRNILAMDRNTRAYVQQIEQVSSNYQKKEIRRLVYENKKRPVRHGYYYEYRELQKLCLSILQFETSIYSDSAQQSIYGVLFDGSWLFEEYIYLLIKDVFIHPENRTCLYGQSLFDEKGIIYPDFISRNSENRIIADAKYKWSKTNNEDFFQLLAYMYRFDSKIGYLFYPNSQDVEELSLSAGVNCDRKAKKSKVLRDLEIKVIQLGLKLPKNINSFEEFEMRMKQAESEFIQAIKQ